MPFTNVFFCFSYPGKYDDKKAAFECLNIFNELAKLSSPFGLLIDRREKKCPNFILFKNYHSGRN
jgi:hypothetical protein